MTSDRDVYDSDNVMGADNQQERLTVEAIPSALGSFLSGFALGEGSFMLVCRPRGDYERKWKISAAFNVSQHDRAPLDVFLRRWDVGRCDAPATAAGTGRSTVSRTSEAESCRSSNASR